MELHQDILVIESQAALQKMLREYSSALSVQQMEPEALRHQREPLNPRAVIFNLQNPETLLPEILGRRDLFENYGGHAPYFALSGEAPVSDELIRWVRLGIQDFLVQPVDSSEISRFFSRLETWEARFNAGSKGRPNRVSSFFSFKGGSGTSLAAVNWAADLANGTDGSVLLADWVLQHGNIGELVDISVKYTLSDFFRDLERVDSRFLENSFSRHASGLYVLPSPRTPEEAELLDAKAAQSLTGSFCQNFQETVLDLGHEINPVTLACLDRSDVVFLVTTPDLPSVLNTQRALEIFSQLGYEKEKKVRLVLNRWRMTGGLEASEIEKNLRQSFYLKIPEDAKNAMKAVNQGLLLRDISKSSVMTAAFREGVKMFLAEVPGEKR